MICSRRIIRPGSWPPSSMGCRATTCGGWARRRRRGASRSTHGKSRRRSTGCRAGLTFGECTTSERHGRTITVSEDAKALEDHRRGWGRADASAGGRRYAERSCRTAHADVESTKQLCDRSWCRRDYECWSCRGSDSSQRSNDDKVLMGLDWYRGSGAQRIPCRDLRPVSREWSLGPVPHQGNSGIWRLLCFGWDRYSQASRPSRDTSLEPTSDLRAGEWNERSDGTA